MNNSRGIKLKNFQNEAKLNIDLICLLLILFSIKQYNNH